MPKSKTPRVRVALVATMAAACLAASASAAALDTADAVRLLEQTTFGPTPDLVAHVQAVGVQGWLAEQFDAPASTYPRFAYVPPSAAAYCPSDPNPQCARDNYSLFLLQNAFFRNALVAPDQLRQRVAFALSQILVTSGVVVRMPYGMAPYQQIFLDHAFDNYETVLTKVTLSPVMGAYLNMVNNDKPAAGVNPNENYARELLQLFTVGLWELDAGGVPLKDALGRQVPTYDQDTIEGYAHVFTGWTYPPLPGATSRAHNPRNYQGEMVGVPANHDFGVKTLLDDAIDAAGKPMAGDLAFALRGIVMHPNAGPFVGRQLIQKLVTGDPSPAYVARVAAAFNDNGRGVRGDLRAVVTAVLTDPEARGPAKPEAGYGKLREPVLYIAAAARALGATSDGVFLAQQARALGQDLFNAPSVFNHYPPDYVVPGTGATGPEFALLNASTAINRYNFANTLVFGTIAPLATLPTATGTQVDWTPWRTLAASPAALLDAIDALLFHGTMPAAMRASVLGAVNAVPATDPLGRARTALYLALTSPEYQVER